MKRTSMMRTCERRGLAMLQVMFAMGSATVLTTAYMASRDNSFVIASNVTNAAASRIAADSGVAMAEAILQTLGDWRTLHTNGLLLDGYEFGGTTLDLEVVDLVTGTPPTSASTQVGVICTATRDGVSQQVKAIASVLPTGADGGATIDLSEFAIFGANRILLQNQAVVARWPKAPLSAMGDRVALGTKATLFGTVSLGDTSSAIDATVYHAPRSSASLVVNANGPLMQKIELGDAIPFPSVPSVSVAPPGSAVYPTLGVVAGQQEVSVSTRHASVTIELAAKVKLSGTATHVVDTDLTLTGGSILEITGESTLIVFGDLVLDNSSILLADDATLSIYVADEINLSDAYIGDGDSHPDSRDYSGAASWIDPMRVNIFGLDSAGNWVLSENSVIKASVYAPSAVFDVQDTSAVYGRVAAATVILRDSSAVFYDPALDRQNGFKNPDSPVFDADGKVIALIKGLSSLSEAEVTVACIAAGFDVTVFGEEYESGNTADVFSSPITEATPRPIDVDYKVVAYGWAPDESEQANVLD